MTTGRINQISWSRPPGPAPFRINNGRRRVPGGPEPPKGPGCNSVITWKGRTSARPPRQTPGAPGGREKRDHPIAPTVAPQTPVRTQGVPPVRPCGRCVACGIRASGGGSGPADTPTNGGSRGAAPPGNLGIRTGQRPTIHRLHRCRGPNGPRASVTPAGPHHAPAHLSRGSVGTAAVGDRPRS